MEFFKMQYVKFKNAKKYLGSAFEFPYILLTVDGCTLYA
jgi:hypothetical protein